MMSDRQRRRICRTTFLVFCLAPTLLIISWILFPISRNRMQQELSNQMGASISIERIETPRPGIANYHSLEIALPAERRPVVKQSESHPALPDVQYWRFPILTLKKKDGFVDCLAQSETVSATHACLFLRQALQRQKSSIQDPTPIRIRMPSLQLILKGQPVTLHGLDFRMQPISHGWMAKLEFQLSPETKDPITIQFESLETTQGPSEVWTLDSRSQAIPTALLCGFLPHLEILGPDGKFQGSLQGSKLPSGWNLSIEGQWSDIDLTSLVEKTTGKIAQGKLNITQFECQVKNNKIAKLAGVMESSWGILDASFVKQIAYWPNLATQADLKTRQPYTHLNCRFRVENANLYLWSGEQLADRWTLANDESQSALIRQSAVTGCSLPLSQFLQSFYSQPPTQIPLNHSSLSILSMFAIEPISK